jgi:RimJ/RimL family protein N-acetyltransferase
VIRTDRLLLRRWRPDDEPKLAAINRDPEVTRYLNRATADEHAIREFFSRIDEHWREHGFGFFALEVTSGEPDLNGRMIGFAGVAYPNFLPELAERPELGWRLARDAWGRGLAYEAASAARDHALRETGLEELISIIHPENQRSRRLAQRLGMELERLVHNPNIGRDVELWRS